MNSLFPLTYSLPHLILSLFLVIIPHWEVTFEMEVAGGSSLYQSITHPLLLLTCVCVYMHCTSELFSLTSNLCLGKAEEMLQVLSLS